jgi:hypothetical protein
MRFTIISLIITVYFTLHLYAQVKPIATKTKKHTPTADSLKAAKDSVMEKLNKCNEKVGRKSRGCSLQSKKLNPSCFAIGDI